MSIKLFGFSTFYVFLDFWHKSKKRLFKSNNVKTIKTNANKQIKIFKSSYHHNKKHITKKIYKTSEILMHGHVAMLMHEYPSSPIRHVRLGWYPYRIGYECCDFQTFYWIMPNRWWMHQSSSSHPSLRNHYLDLLIAQQPNTFCHFLVLLTSNYLHSSML